MTTWKTNRPIIQASLHHQDTGQCVNITDEKLDVNMTPSGAHAGSGSVPGRNIRYEVQSHVDIPTSSGSFATVYEITEESVFYRIAFNLNSDAVLLQVEVDSVDIFPSGGLLLSEIKTLGLNKDGKLSGAFGLLEHGNGNWVWLPPDPFYVESSMKIKMKSSTDSDNKDFESGLAVRRKL